MLLGDGEALGIDTIGVVLESCTLRLIVELGEEVRLEPRSAEHHKESCVATSPPTLCELVWRPTLPVKRHRGSRDTGTGTTRHNEGVRLAGGPIAA